MKYIIDRFEGDFAVVELFDKTLINIPRKAIPSEAKEGSVIDVIINDTETAERTKKIDKLMDDLFK